MAPSRAIQRLCASAQIKSSWKAHAKVVQQPLLRHAHIKSPAASSKGQRVLEKPDRYRPPSHAARLPRRRPSFAGPPLSSEELAAQETKQYPNMMPPKGTFLHWFLNNRKIHAFISMGILLSLCVYIFVEDVRRSIVPEHVALLPSASLLPFHPWQYIGRVLEVYRMHVERISEEVDKMRQRQVSDALKRREYMKAHGMEPLGIFGLLGYKPTDDERAELAAREEAQKAAAAATGRRFSEAESRVVPEQSEASSAEEAGVQRLEERRRPVKKWLGIW